MTESDIASFPTHVVHPDRVLYRMHQVFNDPTFFARSGNGRFDLTEEGERGTCYCALSGVGAFLETFRRTRYIPEHMIELRALSTLSLTRPLRLADLTDPTVIGSYGITGEVSVGPDYSEPQQWAAEFYRAGFDGVFYAARHDPSFTERSAAVFGDSELGEKLFDVATTPIPDDVIEEASSKFSFKILPATPLP